MTLTFAELRKQLDDAEKELAAASELEQKRRAVRKIRRLMRLAEELLREIWWGWRGSNSRQPV